MSTDGGLRGIYRTKLPGIHWSPIETGHIVQGVPDCEGCAEGVAFWVENKKTDAYAVTVRTMQRGWHARRALCGGRSFIAVRLVAPAGPRRGEARDEFWLYPGAQAIDLALQGLRLTPMLREVGGPGRWSWRSIREAFLRAPLPRPKFDPD